MGYETTFTFPSPISNSNHHVGPTINSMKPLARNYVKKTGVEQSASQRTVNTSFHTESTDTGFSED